MLAGAGPLPNGMVWSLGLLIASDFKITTLPSRGSGAASHTMGGGEQSRGKSNELNRINPQETRQRAIAGILLFVYPTPRPMVSHCVDSHMPGWPNRCNPKHLNPMLGNSMSTEL